MRLVVAALLSIGASEALADSSKYEQVRVDVGMSGSWVGVTDRNGAGMLVEIKAIATDNLAIGGRVDFLMMFGGVVGNDEQELDVAMAACGLIKGEFHIVDGLVRPFVGFGVGAYTIGSQTVGSGPDETRVHHQTGRYLGFAPQIGIDLGRARVAATYNAMVGASLEVRETIGGVEMTSSASQNYLSLELSFRFGGGRRRTP